MNQDPFCYPGTSVLKNKLDIRQGPLLEKAEADLSRAKMTILYESPLQSFHMQTLLQVHYFLFTDIYEWAGKLRTINISKKEAILAGKSVWYEDALNLPESLYKTCAAITATKWNTKDKRRFCAQVAHIFAPIWKVHPFREGNTRAVVAFMVLFMESKGFFVDTQLITSCAGYVRDAFVLASAAEPDFYPLTKLLNDAVSRVPFKLTEDLTPAELRDRQETYQQYAREGYCAREHELRPDNDDAAKYSV